MKNINDANEVSFDQLLILRRMLAFNQSLDKSFNLDDRTLYDILFIQRSVSSWILFVQSPVTDENLVLKLLCDYQDARYDLSSSEKRLICQVEALKWNSKFSPDIYYGLACVLNLNANQRQIILSPSVLNPTKDELLTNADYALVMRSLPEERRLDILMSTMSDVSLRDCLQKVVERISQIHKSLEPFSYEESVQWGSYEHIKRKFEHNLALANPIFSIDENKNYIYPDTVRNAFFSLKSVFIQHFMWSKYQAYFDQRIQSQRIKRCHGDLKAQNIWIEESSKLSRENVFILDAIDFNDMYCNIDTLSDVAMLIVDIQTRIGSSDIAEKLLDEYLQCNSQNDNISYIIAYYYLFEKAYVSAAISLIYDDNPELCKSYLPVAQLWLDKLLAQK